MLETLTGALGGALGQVGDVLAKPRQWAWQMLPGLHDDEGAAYSGADVVHNATGLDREGAWAKALGLGAEVLGDPLTYAGAGLGRLGKLAGLGGEAAAAAPAAIEAANPTAKLLGLRRQFGVLKDVVPEAEFNAAAVTNPTHRIVGGGGYVGKFSGGHMPSTEEAGLAGDALREAAANGGYFEPRAGTSDTPFAMAMRDADNPLTVRHENIHGMIDAAVRGGDASGLPMGMRIPAQMRGYSSPLLQALGRFSEEGAAQSLSERTLGSKLSRAARHLLHPDPFYVDQAYKTSELGGALVDYGPMAALGLGATGAGIGGALALNR